MNAGRGPAAPPAIDGYRYVQPLGSGGFADVYLYEQDRPRRKVAVKVLLSDLKTDGARRRFESEANLMAQLSTHPFIVTIYEANVSASGHSYLAMEYCSKPNLDARMRRQRFSVDEALAVGIQVASAVETAHRAGIAHRDIKPANILVTDYNRPALTDFGISGTMDSAADDDGGMSIPWSPPESFGSADADGVMVDVWALGATIYTLLAGHSPFALPAGNNAPREMMSRIASMPLPGLGRIDIPHSLQQVLAVAMAKQPGSRYQSAHALGLALQRIQVELGLSVTSFEVLDDGPDADQPDDTPEDATRIRGVVSIDPRASATNTGSSVRASVSTWAQQPTLPRTGVPGAAQSGAPYGVPQAPDEATVARVTGAGTAAAAPTGAPPSNVPAGWDRPAPFTPVPVEDTQLRPAALQPDAEPGAGAGDELGDAKRRPKWLLLAAGGVLAAAAVTGMVVVNGAGAPAPGPQTKPSVDGPLDAVAPGSVVPAPAKLAGTKAGSNVTFTWENPAPAEGDVYMWRPVSVLQAGEYTSSSEAKAVVAASPDAATCVEVVIRRGNGQASPEPSKACVP